MRKLLPLALCLSLLAIAVSGCASLRALVPGGVAAADAEWDGVAGPVVSIAGSVDPRAAQAITVLSLLGQSGQLDQLGLLLPLTVAGETQPRLVLCLGQWAARCRAIPVNSAVHFAGSPVGLAWWSPKRLS